MDGGCAIDKEKGGSKGRLFDNGAGKRPRTLSRVGSPGQPRDQCSRRFRSVMPFVMS